MVYEIWYQYGDQEPEVIDHADSADEAEELLDKYELAFNFECDLWCPQLEV